MKIDVLDELETCIKHSIRPTPGTLAGWKEALEQHHKDLMGLVDAWRNSLDGEPDYQGQDGVSHYCADQLESLINPKD